MKPIKVFVHTKDQLGGEWDNKAMEISEFIRLPVIGEHLVFDIVDDWYRVELVVHIPRSVEPDYQAEIYAVKVNHVDAVCLAADKAPS